jgi:hypothetical protein
MSFTTPSMEMNLYKVEIVHHIDLIKDGDLPILPNYNDSPFMHPEIFPSTRVGRWETRPHLENYVELEYGEHYKIKLFNYTWNRCIAKIFINEKNIGEWKIESRSHIIIDRPKISTHCDIVSSIDSCFVENNINYWFYYYDNNRFRFTKYGTQSDLISVYFEPEKWTERTITNLMEGECNPMPIWSLNPTKETIMYVRLVGKRRYQPYHTVISFREECLSYIG